MTAYHNENDPYAAAWLRNLIDERVIGPGIVDDRDIRLVRPSDLVGFDQCHFFAGLGGWSVALDLAGWPRSRPVWTGSCPCQSFSLAGKGAGFADERHLWPTWFGLIGECRPATIFGEQVQSAIGHGWLDLVQDDLEDEGYAVGALCAPACSVGAPHIRQRLWVVADADGGRRAARQPPGAGLGHRETAVADSGLDELADAMQPGWPTRRPVTGNGSTAGSGGAGELGDAEGREQRRPRLLETSDGRQVSSRGSSSWADAEWLACSDAKARPTKPGLFPLAHGIPARAPKLRAIGNAIVPQIAAEFVKAYMQ